MPARRRRAILVAAVVLVLLVAAGVGVWALMRQSDESRPAPTPSVSASVAPSASPSPSPSPSTAAPGPTAAPTQPTTPEQPAPGEGPGTAPLAPVEVVTTFAGWNQLSAAVEVGAYVAAVESPGSCTLTLTGPGGTVQRSQQATADASTLACGALSVPGSELVSGTWTASVTYSSATSEGTSPAVEVVVP